VITKHRFVLDGLHTGRWFDLAPFGLERHPWQTLDVINVVHHSLYVGEEIGFYKEGSVGEPAEWTYTFYLKELNVALTQLVVRLDTLRGRWTRGIGMRYPLNSADGPSNLRVGTAKNMIRFEIEFEVTQDTMLQKWVPSSQV
jgi:hypothetical protein